MSVKQTAYRFRRYLRNFRVHQGIEHKKAFHARLKALHRDFFDGKLSGGTPLLKERRCVVCRGNDFAHLFKTPAGFDYCRCERCGMTMMQPIPSEESLHALYNSEEMSFNASGGELSETVRPAGAADLAYVLQFVQDGRLLDIGCGVGGFVLSAQAHFQAEGLEINALHARIGQQNGLAIHNQYSSEFQAPHRYDLVSMLQVIEHLPDPASVVRDARRLLEDEGLLYVSCPNVDSASMRLFGPRHRHVSTFGHLNMYDIRTLKQQVEQEGFQCVDLRTCTLDVELHDLFYHYALPGRFSHRYANYNPFVYQLCNTLYAPVRKSVEKRVIDRQAGSYLRGIFRKVA